MTNSVGTVYSNAATLTIKLLPKISNQPTNVTVKAGSTAAFTVTATGAQSYQWQYRRNASDTWKSAGDSGNKTATLKVTASASKDGYQYRCAVKNSVGTVYSNAATLKAVVKPTITTQPKKVTVNEGSTATFTVKASGAQSYQWQYRKNAGDTWKNATDSGSKTATLKVTASAGKNGYQYRCAVKNIAGTVYSSTVTMTVNTRPTITKQPANVTVSEGNTATFTVKASGAQSYQWQYRKNANDTWKTSGSSGNKTATLKVTASAVLNGFQFRCVVNNSVGTVYSSAATLKVNTA